MSNWIDVNERLPGDTNSYLVCQKRKDSGFGVSWVPMAVAAHLASKGWVQTLGNRVIENVTHWTPLPEPPGKSTTSQGEV